MIKKIYFLMSLVFLFSIKSFSMPPKSSSQEELPFQLESFLHAYKTVEKKLDFMESLKKEKKRILDFFPEFSPPFPEPLPLFFPLYQNPSSEDLKKDPRIAFIFLKYLYFISKLTLDGLAASIENILDAEIQESLFKKGIEHLKKINYFEKKLQLIPYMKDLAVISRCLIDESDLRSLLSVFFESRMMLFAQSYESGISDKTQSLKHLKTAILYKENSLAILRKLKELGESSERVHAAYYSSQADLYSLFVLLYSLYPSDFHQTLEVQNCLKNISHLEKEIKKELKEFPHNHPVRQRYISQRDHFQTLQRNGELQLKSEVASNQKIKAIKKKELVQLRDKAYASANKESLGEDLRNLILLDHLTLKTKVQQFIQNPKDFLNSDDLLNQFKQLEETIQEKLFPGREVSLFEIYQNLYTLLEYEVLVKNFIFSSNYFIERNHIEFFLERIRILICLGQAGEENRMIKKKDRPSEALDSKELCQLLNLSVHCEVGILSRKMRLETSKEKALFFLRYLACFFENLLGDPKPLLDFEKESKECLEEFLAYLNQLKKEKQDQSIQKVVNSIQAEKLNRLNSRSSSASSSNLKSKKPLSPPLNLPLSQKTEMEAPSSQKSQKELKEEKEYRHQIAKFERWEENVENASLALLEESSVEHVPEEQLALEEELDFHAQAEEELKRPPLLNLSRRLRKVHALMNLKNPHWKIKRKDLEDYFVALHCQKQTSKGSHDKISFLSKTVLSLGSEPLLVFSDWHGVLTLPLWEKEVPHYLKKQILVAKEKLLRLLG